MIVKDGAQKAIATLFVFLLVVGCGYRFMPGGEHIDQSLRTVYVQTFANRTSEPGIENDFRSAMIDQFIKGGRFKLADREDLADTVFKGSIDSLTTSQISYQSGNIAAEERMDVTLDVTLEEKLTKNIIWTNKSFTGRGDYRVSASDLLSTQTSRKTAITKLASDTTERVYRLMMSGF